ncbi:hypothetical protein [Agromyces marinus]|uniref:S1 motif domain-containing protein n=1 Tax=Agromyces marinus TaxID=1389020 RepID=A0ABM8H3K6_9MICO|nr:hypothetical protein [Agromyces marinus]BDZ55337.1 hypothetical protein GCM10025870_24100 [Agromyces marinus]
MTSTTSTSTRSREPRASERTVERVATPDQAEHLAARILDPGRTRPLVVVSTPHASTGSDAEASPPLDPERVLDEVGDVADVVVLPTGELSRRVDDLLPDMLQVYGGAGRSYPVGLAADPDWRRSPLRFPHNPARAVDLLVSDAIAHAQAAGLFERAPARARPASGEVRGFIAGGSRALVMLDGGGMATVWSELTAPQTPLDWLICDGCRVTGIVDEDANRLTLDLVGATDATLAEAFPHGSVTLALVTSVSADAAELALHPSHRIRVLRTDVSPNPLDRVDLLLSEGEVVPVRVVHLSTGALHLRLSDVDDDEPVVAPLALIAGGTSWLREGRPLPIAGAGADDSGRAHAAVTEVDGADGDGARPGVADARVVDVDVAEGYVAEGLVAVSGAPAAPVVDVPAPAPARPVPGPGVRSVAPAPAPDAGPAPAPSFDEGGDGGRVHAASARSALQSTQLELDAERARRIAAERRLAEAGLADSQLARRRTQADLDRQQVRELLIENAELKHQVAALRTDRTESGKLLRDARREASAAAAADGTARPVADRRADFPDAESWVRHEIGCAWVERIPSYEKAALPLAPYRVGPEFADSLERLDAEKFAKAMKAVVDVLTGRAERMDGREVHRLRESDAGGSPYRVRADGAHAMRCAIERNTPSARRLHYWVLEDGLVELCRVVLHDETGG